MGLLKYIALGIALLTLLSTGLGVYYGYFADSDPAWLVVENLDDQHEFDVDKDIEFNFFLYNQGGETAFIDYVQMEGAEIEPGSDFVIEPGESLELSAVLEASGEELEALKVLEIWYGASYNVNEINVRWGP
tara:strand:- start:664 stop:1059 length:396 start_codon:yes stop_codon:yes gene_type:complete